jgi:hypothetical protein
MIRFELIDDVEQAKQLWNQFSPSLSLYELWDFRYIFYKHKKSLIHFILGYDNDTPVGLFPLQKNEQENYLEFFGGSYMENNTVFVKPGFEEVRELLYKQITGSNRLEYIIGNDPATQALLVMDEKYFLTCTEIQSLEDYFQKYFSGETRGKMRRKMRHIEAEGITMVKNKLENIEYLFQFNIDNFGERSTFHFSGRKESFRELLTLGLPIYLLSFYIKDVLVGVSFSLLGKDNTYEYLNLGVSSEAPKDLKSYIHLKNIEVAIGDRATIFNAGCSDCGWKELFHLEKTPQYKFDKNP